MAEVISVRFRGNAKNYYFHPNGLQLQPGDFVVVETAQGLAYAQCAEGNHDVPDQSVVAPLRSVVRAATENDRRTAEYNASREKEAFGICEKKIAAHGLEMKLVSVEYSFEGNKIIFFFTADGRVDFRELVKDLAGVFRTRIELRQIGVRDEAKMLGGLGICGRALCCSQFLEEFIPVSIKMAKTQNLSLNPTKISGACGRLMCCLKYEQAAYEDAASRMPRVESFVDTPDGLGNICGVDLLQEEVQVRLDSAPETPRRYKNSEIRVLRSGKGSREGIEIPKDRPQRQDQPRETGKFVRRAIPVPSTLASAPEEEAPRRSVPNRRNNNNNNRNRGRSVRGEVRPKAEKRPERPERPERADVGEKLPVRTASDTTAEKKAAADRAARQEGKPQPRRPYRKPRGKN